MSDPISAQNPLESGMIRIFIQDDGINPLASYNYYGCMSLDGPSQDLGTPEPQYCPSPTQRGVWDIIASVRKAQALGTSDFTARADRYMTDIWFELKRRGCKINMAAVIGSCQTPDQFDDWDAKIVFLGTRLTNLALPTLNSLTGDDNAIIDFSGSFSFEDWDAIKAIRFGEKADATVLAEALDGFFFDSATCGDCGTPSDGCNHLYVLTLANAGSPGLSSQVVYSLNGGSTWANVDIPTLGGLSGTKMRPMGNKVVVISQANGAHHYSPVSSINNGVANWTRVSSGYVATKGPRAIYVQSSNKAYIAGAGGYIYYLTNPTGAVSVLTDGSLTTQDQNDIAAFGKTVVSVGGNNSLLYSSNGGSTFALVTGPAVGVNLTAVWCMSPNIWLVGTGNGKLYCTLNSGTSWTEIGGFPSGISVINDIWFEDELVGYLAAEVNGTAYVFRTTDSGNTWQNSAPHVASLPSAVRVNFVYSCGRNSVFAGGRKTSGGDGMIALAE